MHSTERTSLLQWPSRTHDWGGAAPAWSTRRRRDRPRRCAFPGAVLKKGRSTCRSLDDLPGPSSQDSMTDETANTAAPTLPRPPPPPFHAGRALGAAASLREAAPFALRTVGAACGADLAVLWWEDQAFERLRRLATWRPFTSVDERVVRLDGRDHLRVGEDVPGRVWES